MPHILGRDSDLDLNLESEARTTLTIVGVALGFLVLATTTISLRRPISQYIRFHLGMTGQNQNPTVTKSTAPEEQFTKMPTPSSFPLVNMVVSQSAAPLGRERNKSESASNRRAGFFGPMRKYASTPRHSTPSLFIHRGANGLHTPPPAKLISPPKTPTMTLPMRGTGFVSPHVMGWIDVADSVVGKHPHAQPLNTRVATKSEIDMISGHVYIPWAYKSDNRPTPVPVRVMKPVVDYPVQPDVLKDVGNIRGRDIRIANATTSQLGKAFSNARRVHRTRGKENMPTPLITSTIRRHN